MLVQRLYLRPRTVTDWAAPQQQPRPGYRSTASGEHHCVGGAGGAGGGSEEEEEEDGEVAEVMKAWQDNG